jgi:serine/threonine protein phosphatase 1
MRVNDSDNTESNWVSIREISDQPERLFAVGDIHGHLDEVSRLVDYLVDSEKLSASDQLIFIGDYIDRGSDSKGVIDKMLELRQSFPKTVFLKGNHEDMLLSFLGLGGNNGEYYLQNGGLSLFDSYGIKTVDSLSSIFQAIPGEHLDFIRGLELGVSLGEFVFVHAGLAPSRDFGQQIADDLLWIRDEFLESTHNFKKTIVFGHTSFSRILLDLPYKIGIDTGIAYGGKLSAVELTRGETFAVGKGQRLVAKATLR